MFENEFKFKAEWHFFATSHGKSPCDAIGGTFKRNCKIHNMKSTANDQINSARALYEWAKNKENNKESEVHFIFCNENEYEEHEKTLTEGRFSQQILSITGSQSLHAFTPYDEKKIGVRTISDSTEETCYTILEDSEDSEDSE